MKIIECSRDAMQGLKNFIPTKLKIAYLQQLLAIGFDTLDFGSYVSPKAIPQMADTAEVLEGLDLTQTSTKLLAIVANLRGAEQAALQDKITYLGYPLSLSETFQQRNTRKSISAALTELAHIQEVCTRQNKILVTYLSMGFGNPYNDPWNAQIVLGFVEKLASLEVRIISLADTVGVADPEDIAYIFNTLIPAFSQIEFGAHLHVQSHNWQEKVAAALKAGCTRFDGAIKGFGGCPMASDTLTGNLATENLVAYFTNNGVPLKFNRQAFEAALALAEVVFISE